MPVPLVKLGFQLECGRIRFELGNRFRLLDLLSLSQDILEQRCGEKVEFWAAQQDFGGVAVIDRRAVGGLGRIVRLWFLNGGDFNRRRRRDAHRLLLRCVSRPWREVGAAGDDCIDATDGEQADESKRRGHRRPILPGGAALETPKAGARTAKRHVQTRPDLARHLRKRNAAATPNLLSFP